MNLVEMSFPDGRLARSGIGQIINGRAQTLRMILVQRSVLFPSKRNCGKAIDMITFLRAQPADHTVQTKSLIKLEDLDITTLNPAEAKTWEVLGEAWINTHGRPPEGPDVMMWFMNATAEKMSSAAGMNGNVMGNVMTGAMPDMTGLTPTMNMMPMDNSHQQARLDWNDDGPYSGGGGQRGGGAGGRGRW
jgi:hypothetical protein